MADADMTLHEAADLLGVHYMTAYRYVRLGLLPAHKVGSSWRVERADLEAFRTGSPIDEPGDRPRGRRRAPWAERLEARLIAGDSRGAWGVVEAAMAAGTEVDELYLDVVAPAMTSIGQKWERGELDVATEHRASGIAMRLVGRLGPRFVRRGRTRGTIVLGTPAGERHFLPVALLADLLRAAGWEVSDLGADVPPESFAAAARSSERLVAVGVSITSSGSLAGAAETIAALHEAVPGVPVLAGGHAVRDAAQASALGADAFAADGRGVVALVEELVHPPSRRAHGGDVA